MNPAWPMVPIGDVLRRSEDWISIDPGKVYKEVTVKLWGRGVVLRREVPGAEIQSDRRARVRAGQFILSRIDARNGALGVVPGELDGAVVSNDFPAFTPDPSRLDVKYLGLLSRTQRFVDLCRAASEGTTNRVRLKEDRFLSMQIALPPLPEQRRIAARLDELATRVRKVEELRGEIRICAQRLLQARFHQTIANAKWLPMAQVAPLERRPVRVVPDERYAELGVKSFGRGTFHKHEILGFELGDKRVFRIEPGDLLFNIVFAWEGAVAVAQPRDSGRVGSHRFLTCVPKSGVATAEFLRFYFLTANGLEQLGAASPGGAGRNRTLGVDALGRISVPVPDYAQQLGFDDLQRQYSAVASFQAAADQQLAALLPSSLARVFN